MNLGKKRKRRQMEKNFRARQSTEVRQTQSRTTANQILSERKRDERGERGGQTDGWDIGKRQT